MNKINSIVNWYGYMPVQAKAALWYAVCNVLQKGISFVTVPVYIRMLTASEYGRYVTFLSWKDIILIFATLNLFYGVYTKSIVDHENDRDRYTSSMQCLCTAITFIVFMGYLLVHRFGNTVRLVDTKVIIAFFLYCLFTPAYSFWMARQRVEYKYVRMIAVSLFVSFSIPLTSLCLLYFTDLRENAIIYGYLMIQSLAGAVFYCIHLVRGHTVYVKEYWISGLRYNLPLIPYYLSSIILGQADRIMITYYAGSDKAGIYSLAYQVSIIMNVVTDAVNGTLTPWVYTKLKEHDYAMLKSIPTVICIFLLFVSLGVMMIAPEAVLILGTKEYSEAISIIPSVTVSVYFIFCYGLFCNIEFYYCETKFITAAALIGACSNIILNAVFIPWAGYLAAGYTTAFSYFFAFIIHLAVYEYLRKNKMGKNEGYNTAFIVKSCVILWGSVFFCDLFYSFGPAVRYLLILILLAIAVVYRKKMTAIIAELKNDYVKR